MRVAVIGAGIVGVTTAYELAADGHQVFVFERAGSVAAEASFAHAGVVAIGDVTPWPVRGIRGQLLRALGSRHSTLRIRPTLDPATFFWLLKSWRASRLRTGQANRARLQRLHGFSRDRLHRITGALRLDYERSPGYLVLLRSRKDLALIQPGLDFMAEAGAAFQLLDPDGCRMHEPGLNPQTELHAGVHWPDDEVGNCRQFAFLLREQAQRLGASFAFHSVVERLEAGPNPGVTYRRVLADDRLPRTRRAAAPTRDGPPTEPMADAAVTDRFDAVVVCAALGSAPLLRPLGIRLPLLAVHGYSVTAPLRHHEDHPDHGPRSGLMDERHRVAICRLGSRVRVAGSAEIGGRIEQHSAAALETLYTVLNDWFPGTARMSHAQRWKGARPMLPDGPPVLGRSGVDGIWLNLGHGASGWALACGSARLVADLVTGRTPAIDTEGLGIERLRG